MEKTSQDENPTLDPSADPAENQNIEETRPWRLIQEIEVEKDELGLTAATPVSEPAPGAELTPDAEKAPDAETAPGAGTAPDTVPGPGDDAFAFAEIQASVEEPKGYEATGLIPVERETNPPDSLPTQGPPPTKPPPNKAAAQRRPMPWFFLPLLGLLFLLVVLLLSGFGGYSAGIGQRKSAEKTQAALTIGEQYQLGLQDMEQGAYARALQRFEYVVELDPSYPGVTEKLAAVMLELNTTATPTLLPTASLTPTPDTRDSQQLLDLAQQGLAASDWDAAIDNLLALRKTAPDFRAIDVDGMLFLALRNRGRDKILKEADLEGGMYDLTLATKFGPLDAEAQGLLSWSGLYITGASFWDIDWEQAVSYFSQVAPQLPNLMDGSKMTATERLRQALFEWGNQLARNGQYCRAVKAYQESLAIAPDPSVQQAGELAAKGCEGGDVSQATAKPNKKNKATQTP